MSDTQTTITFSRREGSTGDTDGQAPSLQVVATDNDGNTSPQRNTPFKVRMKNPGGLGYQMFTTGGSVSQTGAGLKEEVIEYLKFTGTDSKTLKDLPAGPVTMEWVGSTAQLTPAPTGGIPSITPGPLAATQDGRAISLDKLGFGVLKVTYETDYNELEITCSDADEFLMSVITDDGEIDSYESEVEDPVDGASKDVTLTLKNYCTDGLIVGANVTVTGPNGFSWTGLSNNAAQCALGLCKPGTYTVVATKDGYNDTDKDALYNDTFTIDEA